MTCWNIISLFAIWALSGMAAPGFCQTSIEAVPGQERVVVEYEKATDFSGLAWVSGRDFYAVSNRAKAIFPLQIDIEPATGKIGKAQFGAPVTVKTSYDDLEGIAWVPAQQRVYLSSETAHGIVGFDPVKHATFAATVPSIFRQARRNLSLESLTFGAEAFWTANEDTLACDGPESSAASGGLVRLQKMDAQFKPLAQYAYRTEKSLFRAGGGGTGVTDLCALPNGELLVLERVVGLGLSARIFLIDPTGATDTSKLPSLTGGNVKPVAKTLLFERFTAATNYEGLALGPELADGWRSLILIADSNGETKHSFMPLRIRVETPRKP